MEVQTRPNYGLCLASVMESPNPPPAHDFFTPAWLKLPDPQLTKKNASSVSPSQSSPSTEAQSRRFSNGFSSSHRKDLSVNSINGSLDRPFDSRFSTNHDSSSYLNSRHNSFGSSEQAFTKPNPQTIHNANGRPKKLNEPGSRSPFRTGFRDKPFGHHSNKVNKNVDSFKNFNMSSKKFNKSSDGLDNEPIESTPSKEENCNVFNQEFPSLVNINGENSNGPNDNCNVQSAWTNPSLKSKVLSTSKNCQLINSTVANFDNNDGSNRSEPNGTSKVLMASVILRNSLIGKKSGGILKENYHSRIQPVLTKTTAQTPHSMEILFKNSKKKSNKEFFKSIQNEDKGCDKDTENCGEKLEKLEITANNRNVEDMPAKIGSDQKYSADYENDLNNALNINKLLRRQPEPSDDPVLSSSLEAEHRLLIELGWKAEPDDDPSYAPLTEDEVKEFYARNGFKPVERKATPAMPRPSFQDSDDLEDESSSSSDDD